MGRNVDWNKVHGRQRVSRAMSRAGRWDKTPSPIIERKSSITGSYQRGGAPGHPIQAAQAKCKQRTPSMPRMPWENE